MDAASEPHTVALSPVLDLNAAAPLREQLLALRGAPVTLDASAVQRLGGLCLQVLMSARASWSADGVALRLAAASAAFDEQLAAFGGPELQYLPAEGQA